MNNTTYIYQVQDSIPEVQLQRNPVQNEQPALLIERKTLDLSSIERRLDVDSARIVKPRKVYPIKKTIPYIPIDDTISHPTFNTLNGKYEFEEEINFQDEFNYDWIKPVEKTNIIKQTPEAGQEKINAKLLKETITHLDLDSKVHSKEQGFIKTDWMLAIIIFILILFGWIKVVYGRYVQIVVQASYNYFAARKIQEEGNILRKQVFKFMNILFYVVMALFTAQFISYYQYSIFNAPNLVIILLSLIVFVLIYSIKGFILLLLDFIFLGKGAFMTYYTTVFIYNKLLSFIMVPIVSVIPFVPTEYTPRLFQLGLLVFSIMYIMRIFRGIQTGIKNRLSIFYLILYLCALEILPLLVILKLIISFV